MLSDHLTECFWSRVITSFVNSTEIYHIASLCQINFNSLGDTAVDKSYNIFAITEFMYINEDTSYIIYVIRKMKHEKEMENEGMKVLLFYRWWQGKCTLFVHLSSHFFLPEGKVLQSLFIHAFNIHEVSCVLGTLRHCGSVTAGFEAGKISHAIPCRSC